MVEVTLNSQPPVPGAPALTSHLPPREGATLPISGFPDLLEFLNMAQTDETSLPPALATLTPIAAPTEPQVQSNMDAIDIDMLEAWSAQQIAAPDDTATTSGIALPDLAVMPNPQTQTLPEIAPSPLDAQAMPSVALPDPTVPETENPHAALSELPEEEAAPNPGMQKSPTLETPIDTAITAMNAAPAQTPDQPREMRKEPQSTSAVPYLSLRDTAGARPDALPGQSDPALRMPQPMLAPAGPPAPSLTPISVTDTPEPALTERGLPAPTPATPMAAATTQTPAAPSALPPVPVSSVPMLIPNWPVAFVAEPVVSLLDAAGGNMVLEITPEELGRLTISVTVQGETALVRFQTETPEAARLLLEAERQLASELARHGMTLAGHDATAERKPTQDQAGAGQGRSQSSEDPSDLRSMAMPQAGLINLIA